MPPKSANARILGKARKLLKKPGPFVPTAARTPKPAPSTRLKIKSPRLPPSGPFGVREVKVDKLVKFAQDKGLTEITTKHFELDDEGAPKMETTKIPRLKTSEKQLDADSRQLEKTLAALKPSVSPEQFKKLRRQGEAQVAIRNYQLKEDGTVKTRKVQTPKVKTSPKELTADLEALKARTYAIRTDPFARASAKAERRTYFEARKKAKEDAEPSRIEKLFGQAVGAGATPVEPAIVSALAPGGNESLQRAGSPGVKSAMTTMLDYLSRPGAAIKAGAGRAGVSAGVIKGDTAKKIKESPNVGESFLHKATEKSVTGATLGQGFFNTPQLGLPIDIVTDPLMYTGVGGLVAKGALRSAALAARIEKAAPEAIRTLETTTLTKQAHETGNFVPLERHLREIAEKKGVSTKMLASLGRDRKAVKAAMGHVSLGDASRAMLAKAKGEKERAATLSSGMSTYVSGSPALESVIGTARSQMMRRALEPGFRIRGLTPLGNEVGSIGIPLPGKLRLPTAGVHTAERLGKARQSIEQGKVVVKYQPELDRLKLDIKTAHAAGKTDEAEKLEGSLKTLQSKVRQEEQMAGDAARKKGMGQTLKELTDRISRDRAMHATSRQGSLLQHGTQRQFLALGQRAIRKLANNPESLFKIQLHRLKRAETGGTKKMEKTTPLNAEEREAMEDLDKIDHAIGKFGQDIGTLDKMLDDYVTRIYQETGDPFGLPERGLLDDSAGVTTGGGTGTFAARHRKQFESSSMVNKEMLARQIHDVSTGMSMKEALDMAEEWFQHGKIRMTIENMVRATQRGQVLKYDELTDIEKQAYHWSRRLQSDKGVDIPIFQDAKNTEGVLKMSSQSDESYKLGAADPHESLPYGEATANKAFSAKLDRERLERALVDLEPDSPLAKDFTTMIEKLDDESYALVDEAGVIQGQRPHLIEEIKDPVDYTARLPDIRATDRKLAVVLDPRASLFYRVAPEGRAAAFRARWGAIDTTLGRSITDASDRRWEAADGVTGDVSELKSASMTLDEWEADPETLWHTSLSDEPMAPGRPIHLGTKAAAEQRATTSMHWNYLQRDNQLAENVTEHELSMYGKYQPEDVDAITVQLKPEVRIATTRDQGDAWQSEIEEFVRQGYDGVRYRNEVEDPGSWAYVIFEPEESLTRFSQVPQRDGWVHKGTGDHYAPDDIMFPEKSLVSISSDDSIFYDIHTHKEYVRPSTMDSKTGVMVENFIGQDRLWPAETLQDVKLELARAGEEGYQMIYKSGMETLFGRTMSLMRYSVTTLFPAYHIRNMISDALISLQADTGVAFHPILNTKLAAAALARGESSIEKWVQGWTINIPGWEGMTTIEDFLLAVEVNQLRSTQHIEEFARLAETGKFSARSESHIGRLGQSAARGFEFGPTGQVGKRAIELGARREDIIRFQTFTQRLRRNGGDAADATWYMIKHHFDYGDLRLSERRIFRNLFLFYTWYRKNIPKQFLEIISRPGFFSAVGNAYSELPQGGTPLNVNFSILNENLPDLQGEVSEMGLVPDYMIANLGAGVINWNDHTAAFAFGAPWNDLNLVSNLFTSDVGQLQKGVLQGLAFTNPGIGMIYQFASKQDILTGRGLKETESGGMANLLDKAMKLTGLGSLNTNERGEATLPWWANVGLRNLPFAGRASSSLYGVGTTRDPGRANQLGRSLSWLHGINLQIQPNKGPRLRAAWIALVTGRASQRETLSKNLSGDKDPDKKKRLAEFDKETKEWAENHHIPPRYLKLVSGLGPKFYESKSERGAFQESGGASDPFGKSSGDPFGGAAGLGYSLNVSGGPSVTPSEDSEAMASAFRQYDIQRGKEVAPKAKPAAAVAENAAVSPVAEQPLNKKQLMKQPEIKAAIATIQNAGGKLEGPLEPDQLAFAQAVAEKTGLGPKVVAAFLQQEGGHGGSDHNWLNIGYTGAGPNPVTTRPEWNTIEGAAELTAQFFRGELQDYTASDSIQAILQAKGDQAQLQAIGASDWSEADDAASIVSHYSNFTVKPASPEDQAAVAQAEAVLAGAGINLKDIQAEEAQLWHGSPKGGRLILSEGTKAAHEQYGGLMPEVEQLGKIISARVGKPLDIMSGHRVPGGTTASGGISDHGHGGAMDIAAMNDGGAGTAHGDAVAVAAVRSSGGTKEQEKAILSGAASLTEVPVAGGRIQIIWKDGGDHENHVHVGFRPDGGGASSSSAGTGGAVGGGAVGGTALAGTGYALTDDVGAPLPGSPLFELAEKGVGEPYSSGLPSYNIDAPTLGEAGGYFGEPTDPDDELVTSRVRPRYALK